MSSLDVKGDLHDYLRGARETLPAGRSRWPPTVRPVTPSQWLDHVPLIYTFNLAGNHPSALPAGERGRYTLGGFTDATFTAMKVLDDGRSAAWPF